MQSMSKINIEEQIKELPPSWEFKNNFLFKEFTSRNFVDAFSFTTAVALEAEKMYHHPNWENVCKKVSVSLKTHTAGGETEKNFKMAGKTEHIYLKYVGK